MKFEFPNGIKVILETLEKYGFEAYVVGGAIRDMLMGETPKDYDIATNALPHVVVNIFDQKDDFFVIDIDAKSYHVVKVNGVDIATYRRDNYDDRGMLVSTTPVKDIHEDLGRRDFTINSMAVGLDGKLINDYGGQRDLEYKLVSFVGNPVERIMEDPNRIIRAARFAARIGGTISGRSMGMITSTLETVYQRIPAERIQIEIIKAMDSQKPSIFFRNLDAMGALKYIFPTLAATVGVNGGKQHREQIFDHSMMVGDHVRRKFPKQCKKNPLLPLAAYLHDCGKAYPTFKDGEIHFYGHEDLGSTKVAEELKALKFLKSNINYIFGLIKIHMDGSCKMSPKSTRKLLYKIKQHGLEYQDWIMLHVSDRAGNLAKEPLTEKAIQKLYSKFQRELNPETNDGNCAVTDIKDLAISGTTIQELLNIGPSQMVGVILQYLLDRTILDPSLNNKEKLVQMIIGKHPKKPSCPIHAIELTCDACNNQTEGSK